MTEFEEFKKEFDVWSDKFGLMGWNIYYKHEDTGDANSDITYNILDMNATVRLNTEKKTRGVRELAKHEAIHLLLAHLDSCAKYRYITLDDLESANESLVHKLEKLIQ